MMPATNGNAPRQRGAGTTEKTLPSHYTTFAPPDYEGYLTEAQLDDLSRLKLGLHKIGEMIDRVNALASATGLELRLVPTFHAILMLNDISVLRYAHGQAITRIQDAAVDRIAA